jgi:hypothetical protein
MQPQLMTIPMRLSTPVEATVHPLAVLAEGQGEEDITSKALNIKSNSRLVGIISSPAHTRNNNNIININILPRSRDHRHDGIPINSSTIVRKDMI